MNFVTMLLKVIISGAIHHPFIAVLAIGLGLFAAHHKQDKGHH